MFDVSLPPSDPPLDPLSEVLWELPGYAPGTFTNNEGNHGCLWYDEKDRHLIAWVVSSRDDYYTWREEFEAFLLDHKFDFRATPMGLITRFGGALIECRLAHNVTLEKQLRDLGLLSQQS